MKKSFKGPSEINTVIYDPAKIDVEQMEKLLKRSGTYIRTVKEPE